MLRERTTEDVEKIYGDVAAAQAAIREAARAVDEFVRETDEVFVNTEELGPLTLEPQESNNVAVAIFETDHEGDCWVVWYETEGARWCGAPSVQLWRIDAISGVCLHPNCRPVVLTVT